MLSHPPEWRAKNTLLRPARSQWYSIPTMTRREFGLLASGPALAAPASFKAPGPIRIKSIRSIEVRGVSTGKGLVLPWDAKQVPQDTRDYVITQIFTDQGIVGTTMDGDYRLPKGIAAEVQQRAEAYFIGKDPFAVEVHNAEFFEKVKAPVRLFYLDVALWDIAGRAYGQPVSVLMGGRRRERVPVYASEVMPDTPEEVRQIAARAVEAGYGALKLGWGPLGQDLARDADLVGAARATLGAERALMLDGGRAYTVKSALALLRRVEEHDLYWFEEALQPDDLDGYARLSAAASVRIAAGEADETLPPFRALVERGHVDVLQPDLARCGGFTVARQIGLLERSSGVEIVPHCFSSGVLVAASLHYVATLERASWSEYSVAHSPLVNGILAEPFRLEDGCLAVPDGPGLGVELDEDAIAYHRLS